MSKPTFFIIAIPVIFFLEHLHPLVRRPLFVFPVFIILFILISRRSSGNLGYVVASSLIFDIFSGFAFGWLTGAVLAVYLTALAIKKFIAISLDSWLKLIILTILLTGEYVLLMLIKSDIRVLADNAVSIIGQTAIFAAIFVLIFKKLKIV